MDIPQSFVLLFRILFLKAEICEIYSQKKQGRESGWDRHKIYVWLLDRSSQEGSRAELGNMGQESARDLRALHQDGGVGFTIPG